MQAQTPTGPPHAISLIACSCRSPPSSCQYGFTYSTYADTGGEPSVTQAPAPKASCPLAPSHLATSMLAPLCDTFTCKLFLLVFGNLQLAADALLS